jgi:hypothetical protein
MKCICIDNTDKPNNIPDSHWLIVGQEYTVKNMHLINFIHPTIGIELDEINLDEIICKHKSFSLERFAFENNNAMPIIEFIQRVVTMDMPSAEMIFSKEVIIGSDLKNLEPYIKCLDDDKPLDSL